MNKEVPHGVNERSPERGRKGKSDTDEEGDRQEKRSNGPIQPRDARETTQRIHEMLYLSLLVSGRFVLYGVAWHHCRQRVHKNVAGCSETGPSAWLISGAARNKQEQGNARE